MADMADNQGWRTATNDRHWRQRTVNPRPTGPPATNNRTGGPDQPGNRSYSSVVNRGSNWNANRSNQGPNRNNQGSNWNRNGWNNRTNRGTGWNHRNNDPANRDNGKGTMAQLLEGMKGILLRLTLLEGGQGSDLSARGASAPPRRQSGPSPRTDTTQSSNLDFSSVCKSLYRQVQLQHHAGNWIGLPAALKKRLDKFAGDLKPPMVDDEFKNRIKDATRKYEEEISRITRQHLDSKLTEAEREAGYLNPDDLEKAQSIAEKYIQTRLGARLAASDKDRMLQRAMSKIGKPMQRTEDSEEIHDVPSQAEMLERGQPHHPVEDQGQVTDDDSKMEDEQSNSRPDRVSDSGNFTLNKNKRKGMASSPSPVATRSRFASLDRSTEPDNSQASLPATWTHKDLQDEEVVTDMTPSQGPAPLSSRATRKMSSASQTKEGLSSGSQKDPPPRLLCRIMEHTGDKARWSVQVRPQCKVLVIGDSNFRITNPSDFPFDWEVHCYPGATYKHVIQILNRYGDKIREDGSKDLDSLDHIVIQVGINHRDDALETIKDQIVTLERVASALAKRVTIVGVSVGLSLDEAIRGRVAKLNQHLSRGSWDFIPPLPVEDVGVRAKDSYKIHFDQATLDRVAMSIRNHILNPPLN